MVGRLLDWEANLCHRRTPRLWTPRPSTICRAAWRALLAPACRRITKPTMRRSSRRSDCSRFARFRAATPGTARDGEAIRRSVHEHPFWAQRCEVVLLVLWGGHWGCDKVESFGVTLRLRPEGLRRRRLPPCLCRCSWRPGRAQGRWEGFWHPISGWEGPHTHSAVASSSQKHCF